MNNTRYRLHSPTRVLIAAGVALALAACAAAPPKSTGAADARAKLTVLQSDANLANQAPVAIQDAEAAVVAAEAPQTDEQVAMHLAYLADRKVEIAEAQSQARFAEAERKKLGEQRESARLDARTREADVAKGQVASAEAATVAAVAARDASALESAEMQRQ